MKLKQKNITLMKISGTTGIFPPFFIAQEYPFEQISGASAVRLDFSGTVAAKIL